MKLTNKKSISIILSFCFLLTLFSCSQNNNPVDEPDEPIIDEKVLKLLRLYYYVDISKISNLDIDDVTSKTINHILCEYYDEYSGVRLKSKKFLKEIE